MTSIGLKDLNPQVMKIDSMTQILRIIISFHKKYHFTDYVFNSKNAEAN